jgi:hypothetical protein
MAYKLENFLIQVSGTDRLLKIKDNSGIIKYTIDGFSITSLRAINNIVKIVTKSNTIDLDFSTTNEARIALSRIQAQIDLLKEKTPIFIDKKISNYITSTASQGPQGTNGSQGFQGLADRYSATSSTPLQIPEAGYVANLVTQTSLAYTPGQSVLVYNTLAENYMDDEYVEEDSSILFIGQIDNYIPSTGDLQLVVSSSVGFGLTDSNNETATYSFWYINLTGQSGQDGAGAQGPTGSQGPTGPSILPIVGTWSLSTGANTVSFTVTGNESYIMWVNGNIPNGIVNWNATVTLSNSNVPVIGVQYGWYYLAGNDLVLTSIPNQIVGDAGTISTSAPGFTNSNTFTFGIDNNSGSSQIIYYGYTKVS